MKTPTPESKLAALPLHLREAVERVRAAGSAEARVLAEAAKGAKDAQ